jgi:hypothetical protein
MKVKFNPFSKLKGRQMEITPRMIGAAYITEYGDEMKSRTIEVLDAIRNGEASLVSDADAEERIERVRRLGRNLLVQLDEEMALLEMEARLQRSRVVRDMIDSALLTEPVANASKLDAGEHSVNKEEK